MTEIIEYRGYGRESVSTGGKGREGKGRGMTERIE